MTDALTVQPYELLVIPRGGVAVGRLMEMVEGMGPDDLVDFTFSGTLVFTELGVVIDAYGRSIQGPKGSVEPTKTEFDIINFLAKSADMVVTREEILESVWQGEFGRDLHAVDVHLSNAKPKLERAGIPREVIRTVRGIGFMFRTHLEPVNPVDEE